MEKVRVRGRVSEPLSHYLNYPAVIAAGLALPWEACPRRFRERRS